MQKSLSEFQLLTESELVRMISDGPLLVTKDDEPRFVAQSIDAFEAMVRRLRELESPLKRRAAIREKNAIPFQRP